MTTLVFYEIKIKTEDHKKELENAGCPIRNGYGIDWRAEDSSLPQGAVPIVKSEPGLPLIFLGGGACRVYAIRN